MQHVLPQIRRAHDILWERFFSSATNLFYEYDGWSAGELPTPAEISACQPNTAGWTTGMEDCCLNGAWILDGLLSAYHVTGEATWAEKARLVWRGLDFLGSVSSTPGFITRGLAPGGTNHYPNSSADQYTAFVFATWRYATSPIASSEERYRAAQLMDNVCRLVESFHNDIPTEDLCVSIYGDASALVPNRACRLLEFYKAGHVLTGDPHWAQKYAEAIEADACKRIKLYDSYPTETNAPAIYVLRQDAAALRLLYECETDAALRAVYGKAINAVARLASSCVANWHDWAKGPHGPIRWWRALFQEFIAKYPLVDYRDPIGHRGFVAYFRSANPSKANDDSTLRRGVEALAIIMLAPDDALRDSIRDEARQLLGAVDYEIVRTIYPLASLEGAYWRGVDAGLFSS